MQNQVTHLLKFTDHQPPPSTVGSPCETPFLPSPPPPFPSVSPLVQKAGFELITKLNSNGGLRQTLTDLKGAWQWLCQVTRNDP
jgi:hypothetical protein